MCLTWQGFFLEDWRPFLYFIFSSFLSDKFFFRCRWEVVSGRAGGVRHAGHPAGQLPGWWPRSAQAGPGLRVPGVHDTLPPRGQLQGEDQGWSWFCKCLGNDLEIIVFNHEWETQFKTCLKTYISFYLASFYCWVKPFLILQHHRYYGQRALMLVQACQQCYTWNLKFAGQLT